jgi:hypothetical protein
MKDVLFYLLMYKIWNTEFHSQHETLVAVTLTLWIVMNIYEFYIELTKK